MAFKSAALPEPEIKTMNGEDFYKVYRSIDLRDLVNIRARNRVDHDDLVAPAAEDSKFHACWLVGESDCLSNHHPCQCPSQMGRTRYAAQRRYPQLVRDAR